MRGMEGYAANAGWDRAESLMSARGGGEVALMYTKPEQAAY